MPVTWGVTYPATAIEQLAHRRFRFGRELRAPVAESLQRQAVNLAIFSLMQVTMLPGLMMRPPERLAIADPWQ
jgi:hypothetical protein